MNKRNFPRRAFLGGAGALISLPLFETFLPKKVHAADLPLVRFLAYYVPCGMHMPKFTPQNTGAGYDLPEILAPLDAGAGTKMSSKVNVLTGLANRPAKPDGPGDHASGTGAFLTNAHPKKTEGADIQNGISVDQVMANALREAQVTTVPSLEIGIDGGNGVGNCDSGYSCAYAQSIAWASATQPLPKLTDPGTIFDQMFAGYDPGESAEVKAKRKLYQTSILNYATDDAKRLQQKLGKADREKLDQYLTGVSELEAKINAIETGPVCEPGERPGDTNGLVEKVDAMTRLMTLAFQCDRTRVISFMLANAGSNRSYDFLGLSGGHHEWSHHNSLPENYDKLTAVDTWEVEMFTQLIRALDGIEDINGKTILDNSIVYLSSEIADGNAHNHVPYGGENTQGGMPILVAGSGGGAFTPGRHIVYPYDDESNAASVGSLYVSFLQAMGLTDTSFGDASGALPNLKV